MAKYKQQTKSKHRNKKKGKSTKKQKNRKKTKQKTKGQGPCWNGYKKKKGMKNYEKGSCVKV